MARYCPPILICFAQCSIQFWEPKLEWLTYYYYFGDTHILARYTTWGFVKREESESTTPGEGSVITDKSHSHSMLAKTINKQALCHCVKWKVIAIFFRRDNPFDEFIAYLCNVKCVHFTYINYITLKIQFNV